MSTAQSRHSAKTDAVGHGSVQPWSAGPIFPFVIVRTEHHGSHGFNTTWRAINGPGGYETSEFIDRDALVRTIKAILADERVTRAVNEGALRTAQRRAGIAS